MAYTSILAAFGVIAVAAAAPDSEGRLVTLHKVGFPERFVRQRPACGELNVTKSLLNPVYWMHLTRGFHEGLCAASGYKTYELAESVQEKPLLPFIHPRANTSFNVYTRDPDALDAVGCVARSCKTQLKGVLSSGYTQDIAKCIKPAFGPCAPKAWECLGDDACMAAVKCMPELVKRCGTEVMKALEDKSERDKIMCIHNCKNDKMCVLTKCGKNAIACFVGTDKMCHDALTCLPDGLLGCSKDAFGCLLRKSSVCRENVKCLAAGAESCADPAVNALTDTSIADLVVCANEQCPAVEHMPEASSNALVLGAEASLKGMPHYPGQIACMGLHCTGKAINLLRDREVGALTACLPTSLEKCGTDVWNCLGDEKCFQAFGCWTRNLLDATNDLWEMLVDDQERMFDEDLFNCATTCAKEEGHLKQAACVLGKCGVKATRCFLDDTCRKLFLDLPSAVVRCGPSTLKMFLDRNSTFYKSLRCGAVVAGNCGSEGVELLRDTNIAELLECNSQCTRTPGSNRSDDLLVVV